MLQLWDSHLLNARLVSLFPKNWHIFEAALWLWLPAFLLQYIVTRMRQFIQLNRIVTYKEDTSVLWCCMASTGFLNSHNSGDEDCVQVIGRGKKEKCFCSHMWGEIGAWYSFHFEQALPTQYSCSEKMCARCVKFQWKCCKENNSLCLWRISCGNSLKSAFLSNGEYPKVKPSAGAYIQD